MKRLGALPALAALLTVLPAGRARAIPPEATLTLANGYRNDNFNFNIAGLNDAGQSVNVLSELSWKNINIDQLLGGFVTDSDFLYTRTNIGWGWIFGGTMQDSDYNGNNRTQEFSRSVNDPGGTVLDTSFGAGYPFRWLENQLRFVPLAGYAYDRQQFTITNGDQVIPPSGRFPGLNSTYHAQWWGPWLGFDLTYAVDEKISWTGSFEYHWADFRATDNHNLRTDLQHPESFIDTASGGGITGSLGLDWALTERWILGLKADFISWSTGSGVDSIYFSDGTTGTTPLNQVNWSSWGFSLGVKRRFTWK